MPSDKIANTLQQALSRHQQGKIQEALELYQQVLAADPGNFEGLHGVGILYGQAGRFEEALKFINQACAIQPNNYIAQFNRGKALQALRRFDESLAGYDRTLSLKPDFAEAFNNRGNVLRDLRREAEALASYDQAIALNPGYILAYHNRGAALLMVKRYADALANYDKVLSLKPDFAEAHNNRGNVLRELQRFEEALACYDKALALNPNHAEFYNNRASALKGLHRYEEAMAGFDKAIELRPDYADALYNKSHLKLLLGDYGQGWRLYEWRWKADLQGDFFNDAKHPLWLGDRPIKGQTILLHTEQGLGDVVQFSRYVPLVEALGATVVLGIPASLVALLATLKGAYTLVTEGDALPAFDLHCPLMSLPLAFKTTVDSIPAQVPYLTADPQKRAKWLERIGPKIKPRIGLVWSGNIRHRNDSNRNVPLRNLEPLLRFDCEYHALQKEVRPEDVAALEEYTQIWPHAMDLNDFTDTAALIAELDLVIAVDTSVAHLAGALGKAVWILLPYNPDFRWLTARRDSPWYPTARLFRQGRIGDWAGVIEDVLAALQAESFG